jgi:hypothetical protein
VATFLWCGTWSWVRPPAYLYGCFLPLFVLSIRGLTSGVRRQNETAVREILFVATSFLVPLLLGFVYHLYLRVQFTGVGMGTGGYYLFFAWPIVGVWFALSFGGKRTPMLKVALLCAFVLTSLFDIAGWWRSALVYSGVVEKVGAIQTGVGFLPPTASNIAFILNRLQAIAFPQGAAILYATALLLRSTLVTWAIFCFPCSDQTPRIEVRRNSPT